MEKRINRIGQTKPCFVHRVVMEGIDSVISETLAAKAADLMRIL
jgi:SNF2 family DNA or RNA helicase